MYCYCKEITAFFKPWTYFQSFTDINLDDNRRYCLEASLKQSAKTISLICVSIEAVLINQLISKIFLGLGKYTKRYTKIEEQGISFRQIFFMEYFNMGLVPMLNGFDYVGLNKALLGGHEQIKQERYPGFTPDWYMKVGQFICYSLFISAFLNNIKELLLFLFREAKRLRDRGFKSNLKKDPEDDDDDTPNTKLKVQTELENLYIGTEFEGEKAFSRMMSTLFVILSFSSGMPVLYIIGLIFYTFTFYVSKLLIVKFYRTSTTLSRTIPVISTSALKVGIFLHMCVGALMLTNPLGF
jgi:hypothetical protein